ncbi:MAG: XdhC/CoxI family protein [Desulfurococcaceae archaeon]
MSNFDIIKWVHDKLLENKKVALTMVISKEGSGPRDPGAMMAISSDGSKIGTIGGGEVEKIIIDEALKSITDGKPRKLKIALGTENIPVDAMRTRMLCGGLIEVFINVLEPRRRVIIFGGGHVGKPIADIASLLKYDVIVLDTDPNLANNERYPYAKCIVTNNLPSEVERLAISENDIVVIAYGDVEVDYHVLKTLIISGFKGHIWALCSRRRASWMINRLKDEGVNISHIKDRIHSPAGFDIGSDTPEEIAISIWAEIICELKKCAKPVKSLSIVT